MLGACPVRTAGEGKPVFAHSGLARCFVWAGVLCTCQRPELLEGSEPPHSPPPTFHPPTHPPQGEQEQQRLEERKRVQQGPGGAAPAAAFSAPPAKRARQERAPATVAQALGTMPRDRHPLMVGVNPPGWLAGWLASAGSFSAVLCRAVPCCACIARGRAGRPRTPNPNPNPQPPCPPPGDQGGVRQVPLCSPLFRGAGHGGRHHHSGHHPPPGASAATAASRHCLLCD